MQSTWISDAKTRFEYGIVYDCIVIALFFINVLILISIAVLDGMVKAKRAYFIYKQRKNEKLFKTWDLKDQERERKIVEELLKAQTVFAIQYKQKKL